MEIRLYDELIAKAPEALTKKKRKYKRQRMQPKTG